MDNRVLNNDLCPSEGEWLVDDNLKECSVNQVREVGTTPQLSVSSR